MRTIALALAFLSLFKCEYSISSPCKISVHSLIHFSTFFKGLLVFVGAVWSWQFCFPVFEIQHPTLGYLKWSCFCCSVIQPLKSQWKNWRILVRDSCATKINIYQFIWKTSNQVYLLKICSTRWISCFKSNSLKSFFPVYFSLSVFCLQIQRSLTIKSRSLFFFCSAGFFHPITLEYTAFRVSILKWWGFLNALPLWKKIFLN